MLQCCIEPLVRESTTGTIWATLQRAVELTAVPAHAGGESTRRACIASLSSVALGLGAQLGMARGMSLVEAEAAGCAIVPFGSYRLFAGSTGDGSDLDLLILAPQHAGREEYLAGLCEALAAHPHVVPGSVSPLLEAFVPVVKLQWAGREGSGGPVDVDILFTRLDLPSQPTPKPPRYLLSSAVLTAAGGDARTVASLNGVRVNETLLVLLEDKGAGGAFHAVLRLLRAWARARGVYGHSYGYLGGVHCGILAALACLLYPAAPASRTLERLFYLQANWKWPQPVVLVRPPPTAELAASLGYGVRQYGDPPSGSGPAQPPSPGSDGLPILSPCAPVVNTAYNISRASARVIKAEWNRGWRLLAMASGTAGRAGAAVSSAAMEVDAPYESGAGAAPGRPSTEEGEGEKLLRARACLRALLEPAWPAFTRRYEHYIAVTALPGRAAPERAWVEYVESRVRLLPVALECAPVKGLPEGEGAVPVALALRAHLFPGPAPLRRPGGDRPSTTWLVGVDVSAPGGGSDGPVAVDLSDACRSFAGDVYRAWPSKPGGEDVEVVHLTRETLVGWAPPTTHPALASQC